MLLSSPQTAGLLAERLQAWKHAVAYLEDYVGAMEKIHGKHAKEYERALKVSPARYGKEIERGDGEPNGCLLTLCVSLSLFQNRLSRILSGRATTSTKA
jgi:hypothetical protein